MPAVTRLNFRAVLVSASLGAWLFLATQSLPAHAAAPVAPTAAATATPELLYTLVPGDNPWTVSARYLNDMSLWARVVKLNDIRHDRQLRPGQVLRIPVAWLRTEPASAEVLHHHGAVELLSVDGQTPAARTGLKLGAGTRIVTGAQGSVSFKLEDGSVFLVRPDSEVLIERLARPLLPVSPGSGPRMQLSLSLTRGAVDNLVNSQKAAGRYEIKTRAAVAAVRGTEFRVSTDGESTRTEVLDGRVNVGNAQGQALLPRGSGTLTRTGAAPEAARPLLAAPWLDAVPALVERFPIDLPLSRVSGAVRYRSQLVPTGTRQVLLADQVADAARVRLPDMPNGNYLLQVRAIDAQGLEGLPAQRALHVHARPFPPMPLQPQPEGQVTETRPRFEWTESTASAEGPREVLFQLSRTADFSGDVIEHRSPDAGQVPASQDLAPGPWFWRVASATAAEGQGPWSDVQPFRRVVPGPGAEAPQAQDGQLVLRWPRASGAAHYRVEVAAVAAPKADTQADTPATTAPLVDTTQEAAQLSLPTPAPGTYAVRIQGIDDDGHAGPWGPPQQFTVKEKTSRWPYLWLLMPLLLSVL